MEQYEKKESFPRGMLSIDNRTDRISVDRNSLANDLQRSGISDASIVKIFEVLEKFAHETNSTSTDGYHPGSSDLSAAVHSIFFTEGKNNPEEYGLATATELKLVARLVEKSCKKQEGKVFNAGRIVPEEHS